jgi:hypothetical protein
MGHPNQSDENPIFGNMQLRSPRLRDLYRVWQRLCGTEPALPRAMLDPLHIPPRLLPYLAIVDVGEADAMFRYRLVGTGVVNALDRDFTGESVGTFSRRHDDAGIAEGYRYVTRTGLPHRHEGDLRNEGREHVTYERVALPVSKDGGRTIGTILAGFHFDPPTADGGSASGFVNTITREK